MTTDYSKQGFKALAKAYLSATDRFAELEKHGNDIERSALELLDQRINDIAAAMHDKVLIAGYALRAEVAGLELAMTIDGHIMTRTAAPYPDTKKMVITRGRGTPNETRIETDTTLYLLKNNNGPILDAWGDPIYVTIPED